MPVFLSPSWIASLAAVLESAPLAAPEPFAPFTVRHVVSGRRGDAVVYEVEWSEERLNVRPSEGPHPDVIIATDRVTAAAISRGDLTAQEAIEAGRLTVRGELARLATARRLLTAIDDRAAELRAVTTYDPVP